MKKKARKKRIVRRKRRVVRRNPEEGEVEDEGRRRMLERLREMRRERLQKPSKSFEFIVQGYYPGSGWEDLTAADNYWEALQDKKAYEENERQYAHRLIKRRIKKISPNRRRGLRRNPSESPSDYYYKLLRAGVPMDNHESDLYVKDTPTSRAILADWPFGRLERFKNNINSEIYIDIPFAYAPYWEKKMSR